MTEESSMDYALLPAETLAYAAGLFDGEGCVMAFINKENHKNFLVKIGNTNRDVVYWMKEKFGGFVYEQEPGGVRKRIFLWRLNGRAAFDFAHAIYPYSIIKKAQIEMGMYFYRLDRSNRAEHDLLTELLKREKRREDASIDPPKAKQIPTLEDL